MSNVIDIQFHQTVLEADVQNLRQEYSSKGGGRGYLFELSKLFLNDISIATQAIYDNRFNYQINKGYYSTAKDLANEIKDCIQSNLFPNYVTIIQSSNAGYMIDINITEKDIETFNARAVKKLDDEVDKITAKYNEFLNQQKDNTETLNVAKSSKMAAWMAFWVATGGVVVQMLLFLYERFWKN